MQSEKLKALSTKWREEAKRPRVRLSDSKKDALVAESVAYRNFLLNAHADELDAEIAALASPSPAPSEPLRRWQVAKALWDNDIAELKLKKAVAPGQDYAPWPNLEESLRQPYCKSTYRAADAVLAALDSTKASEPVAAKEQADGQ